MKNLSCIVALAAFFAGCDTTPQFTTPFDEPALQPFAGQGTATITGQAFLKTVGGEVRYGAGDNVLLIPVTPYTTEKVRWCVGVNGPIHALEGIQILLGDLRLQKYLRLVVGDGSGNFEFQSIPAGDYYILCAIVWDVPSQYGMEPTGGFAYAETHVAPGETVKVVVTSQ